MLHISMLSKKLLQTLHLSSQFWMSDHIYKIIIKYMLEEQFCGSNGEKCLRDMNICEIVKVLADVR